jgi:isopentenyl phosphate kinase
MTGHDQQRRSESPGRETIVLKLGGSVVTEKDRPETVDTAAVERAVAAVAESDAALVIVHGGGSFGHHHAEEHGVSTSEGTRDSAEALAIHRAMVELNRAVVDALQAAGVAALPVHPLSGAERDADGALSLATGPVERLLAEGFVPVLHGDVIAHEGEGVTVLSGDELVVELAPAVGADRVGLCSTVPGVLDESGGVIDRIETFADVADAVGESDATDVTGGMAGKVRALLDLDVPAQIFGPDSLAGFLAGEDRGTTIDGD